MATTKLTLTVSPDIIEKAKRYAKKQGRSLSDLIENYLKSVTYTSEEENKALTPLTRSLKASFNVPKDWDYKERLSEELTQKYL